MRFRGGGVGHRITRDWDELLQQEGRCDPPEDSSDEDSELDSEDDMRRNKELDSEVEGDEEEEPGAEENDDDYDDEVHVNGIGRISDGIDDVVADDGEELDEVIWAAEGYDAL